MSSDFEEKLATEAAQAAAANQDNQAASGVIREKRKIEQVAAKASPQRRRSSRKGK